MDTKIVKLDISLRGDKITQFFEAIEERGTNFSCGYVTRLTACVEDGTISFTSGKEFKIEPLIVSTITLVSYDPEYMKESRFVLFQPEQMVKKLRPINEDTVFHFCFIQDEKNKELRHNVDCYCTIREVE